MRGLLRPALVVAVVCLVGAAAAPALAADAGYDISAPGLTELPNQTVTFRGATYPVDGYLRTTAGVNTTVEVTAPGEHYVVVYDGKGLIQEYRRGNGSGSYTFDFSGYGFGTYLVALKHDGDVEDVVPVVVRGYRVSHEAPSTATAGGHVAVRVDITRLVPDDAPNGVTVVVSDAETTVMTTAHRQSDGSYEANVSLADLDAGTYTVWALAECTVEAFGYTELEGMSEPTTMELTGGASAAGGESDASTATPTAEATDAPTSTPTATPTDAPGTDEPAGDVAADEPASEGGSGPPPNATAAVGLVVLATVGGLLLRRF